MTFRYVGSQARVRLLTRANGIGEGKLPSLVSQPARNVATQPTATRLVVGLTGVADTWIGLRLLEMLRGTEIESHVVMCGCVRTEDARAADRVMDLSDRTYDEWNQAAKISSGSFLTLGMVVAPCSARSLRSIAMGYANTLIHRAADVTMKEGRPLDLLVTDGTLAPSDRRHVERLSNVPGVRVLPTIGSPEDVLAPVLERLEIADRTPT